MRCVVRVFVGAFSMTGDCARGAVGCPSARSLRGDLFSPGTGILPIQKKGCLLDCVFVAKPLELLS